MDHRSGSGGRRGGLWGARRLGARGWVQPARAAPLRGRACPFPLTWASKRLEEAVEEEQEQEEQEEKTLR